MPPSTSATSREIERHSITPVLSHQTPDEAVPTDLAPPSYESINPSTPIVITFWRFSYVNINHQTKKRYVGRRVQRKTDVALIMPSTTWDDFTLAQVRRSIHIFGWDPAVATRFAFSVILKVGKEEISVDPVNWHAVRDMLLTDHAAELIVSVCPSAYGKPHMFRIMTSSMLKVVRKLGIFGLGR